MALACLPSWFSRLHWTNLYKVNPACTRNPRGPLLKAQEELCKDILRSEIMLLQPKRVLFLTGWKWVEPFLNHWHADVEKLTGELGVQARGTFPSEMGCAHFVVAVHPERKARRPITASILKSFNALEASNTVA
jgi:uracil-DNA glycosylase